MQKWLAQELVFLGYVYGTPGADFTNITFLRLSLNQLQT